MNQAGQNLAAFLDQLIKRPDLQPRDGKTFCNMGALAVAHFFGVHDFDTTAGSEPMMAEQMIKLMQSNPDRWKVVDSELASTFAQLGCLVFAAMTAEEMNEAHAHIAAVYPAATQWSGSLNKNVPVVANVGIKDVEEKESMAFPVADGEPTYYSLYSPSPAQS